MDAQPDTQAMQSSTLFQDKPSSEPDSSSAISELQEAFGHILLLSREPKVPSAHKSGTAASAYPTWTGAFELFSFPRELRDRIYYHYLYRPNGVKYRRSAREVWPPEQPVDVTSLFLTCHQAYDEALQVFCRYNQFNIHRRVGRREESVHSKEIHGILRLFPETPAGLLQRLRMEHLGQSNMYVSSDHKQVSIEDGPAWIRMLREAYTCKSTFPKLREFTIVWQVRMTYRETHMSVDYAGTSEEEREWIWLSWMREWMGQGNVVPPQWVEFEFVTYWGTTDKAVHQRALNGAYARLVKETAGWRDEEAELEESKRAWLEELEKEKRTKKGKRRNPR